MPQELVCPVILKHTCQIIYIPHLHAHTVWNLVTGKMGTPHGRLCLYREAPCSTQTRCFFKLEVHIKKINLVKTDIYVWLKKISVNECWKLRQPFMYSVAFRTRSLVQVVQSARASAKHKEENKPPVTTPLFVLFMLTFFDWHKKLRKG